MTPISLPGEIADTLVNVLESAAVQAELLALVTAGSLGIKTLADNAIANVKVGGVLGVVVSALKGTIESEFNAELALYTPAEIVALITKEAQLEAKALGG